ncbi:MAG TPA: serine hydrolase, partial [Candidatus Elarobacter sp.]|nr:serine hydrolase [Candidatus Elarobacter sp.]
MRTLFIPLALICLTVPALAQRDGTIHRLDGTTISAGRAASIATAELTADRVTGAQIAIINRGRVVWTYAFGFRDVAGRLPMTTDTNVWAASVTK